LGAPFINSGLAAEQAAMLAAVPADARRGMAPAMQPTAPAAAIATLDDAGAAKEDEARGVPVTRTIPVIAAVAIGTAVAVGPLLLALIALRALGVGLLALDALARRHLLLLLHLYAGLGRHALLLRRALLLRSRTGLRGRLWRGLRRSLRRTAPLSAATAFTAAAPFLSLTLALSLSLLATGLLRLRRRGPECENGGDCQSRYSTFLEQLLLHDVSPH